MKIRQGFISNSSSSSFCVPLCKLKLKQFYQILHHHPKGGRYFAEDAWDIEVKHGVLYGWTSMDNFDMAAYLDKIGVIDAEFDHSNSPTLNHNWTDTCKQYRQFNSLCEACDMKFVCLTNE